MKLLHIELSKSMQCRMPKPYDAKTNALRVKIMHKAYRGWPKSCQESCASIYSFIFFIKYTMLLYRLDITNLHYQRKIKSYNGGSQCASGTVLRNFMHWPRRVLLVFTQVVIREHLTALFDLSSSRSVIPADLSVIIIIPTRKKG